MNVAPSQVPLSLRLVFMVILLAVAGVTARAAERVAVGPAFARLRDVQGNVRIERNTGNPGAAGAINQPLQVGDRVRTGDGRAEIELADASIAWIDHDSLVTVRALADPLERVGSGDVIELLEGSVQIEAADPAGAEVVARLDSAAASVYLLSAGLFRVEARRGLTTLVSFGGLAEFSGEEGSVLVRTGQRSVAPAGSAPTEPRRQGADRNDPFDAYVTARAALYAGATTGVNRSDLPEAIEPYLGELGRFGAWQQLPTIGTVWRPHQAGAWAPYQRGRWLASPAGWFWVSDEPWGWAPYRFGRWEQRLGLGWVWIPGAVWGAAWVGYAVTPALVGWCPLNSWNQPVFASATGSAAGAARLDPRAWTFVPIDRFARPLTAQSALRSDRLPRASDLVLARNLPEFDPDRLLLTPGGQERLVEQVRRLGSGFVRPAGDAKQVSFRSEEMAARSAAGTSGGGRRRGAVAITRPPMPPPAHPPRTAAAIPDASHQGHAVQRLVEGAHPNPLPGPASRAPGNSATQAQPHTGPRGGGTQSRSPGSGATLPPLPPPGDDPSDDSNR
ncbi:MAG TPA: DUF6600 domain-containing protein [Dongiaceae bacterium]|nr:DUF6600 domain-containing protein [Dongiaceae bacterium]